MDILNASAERGIRAVVAGKFRERIRFMVTSEKLQVLGRSNSFLFNVVVEIGHSSRRRLKLELGCGAASSAARKGGMT